MTCAQAVETPRSALAELISPEARRDHLENWVRDRVASVLGCAASRIDLDRPLRTMGLDSLMGLQLRNEFEKALALKLPATIVWNYPTVSALARHLATRMNVSLEPVATPSTEPASEPDLDALFDEIAALPVDEVRRLLAEQM